MTFLAHTAMGIGQCLAIMPTKYGLTVATISAAGASCLVLPLRGRHPLFVFVPLVLATGLAALSFEAVHYHLVGPVSGALATALVTLPPGAALTIATVELVSDELVADAGIIVLGTVPLLLFELATMTDARLAALPTLPNVAVPAGPRAALLGAIVFVTATVAYFRWPAMARRRTRQDQSRRLVSQTHFIRRERSGRPNPGDNDTWFPTPTACPGGSPDKKADASSVYGDSRQGPCDVP